MIGKKAEQQKRKLLLILLVTAFFVTGLYLLTPAISLKNGVTLEKGGTYEAAELIGKANGEVIPQSEFLDTAKVGEYDFRFTVRKAFFRKEVIAHYTVVDTTPPKILVRSPIVDVSDKESYTLQDVLADISVDEGEISYVTDLDLSFPGTYLVEVTAVDESGNSAIASYEVKVKDKEPPYIFASGDGSMIIKGSDFSINDVISYGDNYDADPTLEIQGKLNVDRLGSYPLHATLSDEAGNQSSWDFELEVVNRKPTGTYDEEEPYYFADFRQDYAGEGRMLGVDVSEWQGDIDFGRLKEAGCEFIMIRIGFSRNGELRLDASFRDNLAGAKSVGLKTGIYYYSNDKSVEEVKSVFSQITAELGDTQLELPIVFDWENFLDFQEYGLSFKTLDSLYQTFAKEAEARGFESMLYGSKYYLENVWRHADTYPIWLAHYTDWSSYSSPYRMWQVCSWGRVDGIEESTDFDILFTAE